MEGIEQISQTVKDYVDNFGVPVGEQVIPLKVIVLLGTGFFLTVRLGFVQIRRVAHGFAVASGRYDDPDEPGDVSHFQALTTALSATVGIGNIAGAGPGHPLRRPWRPVLDVDDGAARHGDEICRGDAGPGVP